MPQVSPAYAVGRVRALESTLLSQTQLERLTGVQTVEEMARTLVELNWGEVRTRSDIERMCNKHMTEAARLVRECTSDTSVTDCFLIQYDTLNLKSLFKGKMLGESNVALSPLGTLDTQKLQRAVEENNYQDLPPALRTAMQNIEKRSAVKMDPLYVDACLDVATYTFIQERLAKIQDPTVELYLTCKAEFANIMIALRSAAMKRGSAFARELFVPGGKLSVDSLAKLADEPDRLWNLIRYRPYADALSAAAKALNLSAIEKSQDDYLISLLRPHRYKPTSILPLVGYLLARTRESQAVRLLVTAKAASVSQDKILARLRALY